MAVGPFAETSILACEFEGNEAASHRGPVVWDHSDGLNTQSQANSGCNVRYSDAIDNTICNGIQISNPVALDPCIEFQDTCPVHITAQESTMYARAPTPSPMPVTVMPSTDPCLEDTESFACMLHGLLGALP